MRLHRMERKTGMLLAPGMIFWLSIQGCGATHQWVNMQLTPWTGRVSEVEARVGQLETRFDRLEAQTAMDPTGTDHLRLERRMIRELREGVSFAVGSVALTPEARRVIDRFVSDLNGTRDVVLLIVGHTDGAGLEDANYELGQKRAASVARYLIMRRGIDPLRVFTMSYGAKAPLAYEMLPEGRRQNRRVEILAYREAVTSSPARRHLELGPTSQ